MESVNGIINGIIGAVEGGKIRSNVIEDFENEERRVYTKGITVKKTWRQCSAEDCVLSDWKSMDVTEKRQSSGQITPGLYHHLRALDFIFKNKGKTLSSNFIS